MLPKLQELKFQLHHAKDGHIMLTRMLRNVGEANNLPKYNTHLVGAGGIVIHPHNNKILLIKEKSIFGKYIWKIPGGQVDPGEFIQDGMVREVKEETGINAKFLGICAFREVLDFRFGASDIYYIGVLRAESFDIQAQTSEVVESKWETIREFINSTKQGVSMAAMISELLEYLDRELNVNQKKLEDVVAGAHIGDPKIIESQILPMTPFFTVKHFEYQLGKTTIKNALHMSPVVLASSESQKL